MTKKTVRTRKRQRENLGGEKFLSKLLRMIACHFFIKFRDH